MLQQNTNVGTSVFDGIGINGQKIQPGSLLIKANAGVVIVAGMQSFEVAEHAYQTIKMCQASDLSKVYSPPINKLEANNIRAISSADEMVAALTILTEKRLKPSGVWTHREREYNGLMTRGLAGDLTEILAKSYAYARGQYFQQTTKDTSYSEKQIADKAMVILSDELAILFDLDGKSGSDLIEYLLTHEANLGQKAIEQLKGRTKSAPYVLPPEQFEDVFGYSVDDAHKQLDEVQSSIKTTSNLVSLFAAPTGQAYTPPVSNLLRDKTAPKPRRVSVGTSYVPTKPKVNVSVENRSFYNEKDAQVADRGGSRKHFNIAAGVLSLQAFKLHTMMHWQRDKESLEVASKILGISKEDAIKIHNESAEKLRQVAGVPQRIPESLKPYEDTVAKIKPVRMDDYHVLEGVLDEHGNVIVQLSVPLSEFQNDRRVIVNFSQSVSGKPRVKLTGVSSGNVGVIKTPRMHGPK